MSVGSSTSARPAATPAAHSLSLSFELDAARTAPDACRQEVAVARAERDACRQELTVARTERDGAIDARLADRDSAAERAAEQRMEAVFARKEAEARIRALEEAAAPSSPHRIATPPTSPSVRQR